jgi:hypothetical protein
VAVDAAFVVVSEQSTMVQAQLSAIIDAATATSGTVDSHSTSIAGFETSLSNIAMCAAQGRVYDSDNNNCRDTTYALAAYSASEACDSSLLGQMRLKAGYIVYCDENDVWALVSKVRLGSIAEYPAVSCAAIIAAGDYASAGVYWLLINDVPTQQVCNGATRLGGDGSSTAKVATSCATAYDFFGLNNTKVWVQASLTSASAIQLYCQSGASLGADGSTAAKVTSSCSIPHLHFGASSSVRYIDAGLVAANAVPVYCLNGVNQGGDGTTAAKVAKSCDTAKTHFSVTGAKVFISDSLDSGNAVQVYCLNGVNEGGDGTTAAKVAKSCATAKSYFGVTGALTFTDASVNSANAIRVYCLDGVSQGGDGSSLAKVARSCATLNTYHSVTSNKVYVDANLNTATALYIYCLSGNSLGGDGSSAALGSASCSHLQTYWAKGAGIYYVGSSLTYVRSACRWNRSFSFSAIASCATSSRVRMLSISSRRSLLRLSFSPLIRSPTRLGAR